MAKDTDRQIKKSFIETIHLLGEFTIEIGGEAAKVQAIMDMFILCSDMNQSIQMTSQEEEEEEEEEEKKE